jgi:mannose/fructose/N-acetylgalactosamine-specific phosphotransferase system component IIC
VIPELLRIALLGGIVAVDRTAGWNLMLSQPLVGACLAGALIRPGPEWELWVLRVPIAVGAILQLLLTNASLPAAQRPHDTAAAGVIGSSVALLGLTRLHPILPVSAAGLLWVVVGIATGLLAAVAGGWFARFSRGAVASAPARADSCADRGALGSFERLYWGGLLRLFVGGALWAWGGTLLFLGIALWLLPPLATVFTARRAGVLFAALLGAALAAAFHVHVRGRARGLRWATFGAIVTVLLLRAFHAVAGNGADAAGGAP